jgi:hypothetical protein
MLLGHAPYAFVGQRGRLLRLLLDNKGSDVPLPAVRALGIAQHSPRFKELRDVGYKIENRMQRLDGEYLSWYRLVAEPGEENR